MDVEMTIGIRPRIEFVPLSTDEGKIRFFGTLMPALLLLKASPVRFIQAQAARSLTPRTNVADLIASGADDAARVNGEIVFVHRWQSDTFDPFAFARAKTFLAWVTRLVRREGFQAQALDPLSPRVNLPRLAASAGLGNLSPFGLLVHPAFGPRLILSGLRTNFPLALSPRWTAGGCTDCLSCLEVCPQRPTETGVVRLGQCQSCAQCLAVCPVQTSSALSVNVGGKGGHQDLQTGSLIYQNERGEKAHGTE
jgi:epoxyqueuosine reductase